MPTDAGRHSHLLRSHQLMAVSQVPSVFGCVTARSKQQAQPPTCHPLNSEDPRPRGGGSGPEHGLLSAEPVAAPNPQEGSSTLVVCSDYLHFSKPSEGSKDILDPKNILLWGVHSLPEAGSES